jgi:hypothetical protein
MDVQLFDCDLQWGVGLLTNLSDGELKGLFHEILGGGFGIEGSWEFEFDFFTGVEGSEGE